MPKHHVEVTTGHEQIRGEERSELKRNFRGSAGPREPVKTCPEFLNHTALGLGQHSVEIM